LFAINDPSYDVGNSISNLRAIQVNPTFNMVSLYNKFPFIRKANNPNKPGGLGKVLIGLLTSVKNVSATYSRKQGTYLPGYLPQSGIFGQNAIIMLRASGFYWAARQTSAPKLSPTVG
jgi:cell surface protein SprA